MESTCRRYRRTGVLVAATLAIAVAAVAAQSGAASPGAVRCAAGQLTAKVRQGSGAAGTIAVSIAVRNVSGRTCHLRGFPSLRLRDANGPLPTRVVHGGLAILQRPVTTVVLAPGQRASLLVAYSDVPSGSETCRHATSLVLRLPESGGRLPLAFDASPCSHGRLFESPFLRGLVNV
jgi:hypothetical protein